jgi:hypothetical protein
MGIIYRNKKQEPLTIEEMDGNFANLDERIIALETTPPLAEGIAKITQEGDQLTFLGTFGNPLGKAILPKVFPTPKGKWQADTVYQILDWVQVKQSLYSCVQAHRSGKFGEDKENWLLMFEL